MAITDYKITADEIAEHHVQKQDDVLNYPSANENKAVFDELPVFIVGKYNDAIDGITDSFTSQNTKIENVRSALQTQIDDLGGSVNPLTPLGIYATLADLQTAHPTGTQGQAWLVGDDTSNTVYLWDVDQEAWTNVGGLVDANGFRTAYNKSFENDATNIQMNGVADTGQLDTIARADHVHPTDTSRASQTDMVTVKNVTDNIFDLIYPVGSIYMSVNTTSPAVLFGGTWEQINNRFLLSSGSSYTNGATGGASTVTLTAAQSGVPAHGHGFTQPTASSHSHKITNDEYNVTTNAGSAFTVVDVGSGEMATNMLRSPSGSPINRGGQNTQSASVTISGGAVQNSTARGASASHNNMPPYLVVNMWKRTA